MVQPLDECPLVGQKSQSSLISGKRDLSYCLWTQKHPGTGTRPRKTSSITVFPVSFRSHGCNRIPQPRGFTNNRNLPYTFLQAGSTRSRCRQIRRLGALVTSQTVSSHCVLTWWKGLWASLRDLFNKGINLIPKASALNIITRQVRISTHEFGRDIFRPWMCFLGAQNSGKKPALCLFPFKLWQSKVGEEGNGNVSVLSPVKI